MIAEEKNKEIVNTFFQKGFLLSPDLFEDNNDLSYLVDTISKFDDTRLFFLCRDVFKVIESEIFDANWFEIERLRAMLEKKGNAKPYRSLIKFLLESSDQCQTAAEVKKDIKVRFSYDKEIQKKSIGSFVAYFKGRYRSMEKLLAQRQELHSLMSISRLKNKQAKENVSLIAMVTSKKVTAAQNIILEVEDLTGNTTVLVNRNKPDLYEMAKDISNDEVVGINGVSGDNIVFATSIIFPDIPLTKEFKKAPEESYAVFLSDIHVGSNTFLKDKFNKFLDWINGRVGNEKQREMTRKIKYLFIVGDLVDGVGIYPRQEDDLIIPDIFEQYKECARLLSEVPNHIKMIICPGNHDSTRLSEPQPPLFNEFAKPLSKLQNATLVSNPAIVNIASTNDFPGFDVLMYHGSSFDYYVANIDSIRNNGGYDRADLIMKYLLQKRHLAPAHKSTLYVPDAESDCLIIEKVPDFFVSGHIHKVGVSSYRGVSLICGSCWQDITSFQIKVGHHPEPARVPIVNLKTRDTKVLRF